MRIGVCADVHSHAKKLHLVLEQMAQAEVDERWCLGDLIGGGPDPSGTIALARTLDLCLAGNHDAWVLAGRAWPEERGLIWGADAVWLSSLAPSAERHGLCCWHGSPSDPLLGFFDDRSAAIELPDLPQGTLGLVGHTHIPMAYALSDGRVFEVEPDPGTVVHPGTEAVVVANPGAVGPRPGDPAGRWWLEVDVDDRTLLWHHVS